MNETINNVKRRFGIIGFDPALDHVIDVAMQVAVTDLSVLVTGESGSGKESVPKIIHAYSPRKTKTYIAVNCGAIPEGTIDSELFGHEKGAFTGAVESRKGYFEEANGGTLFLDEVADLPLSTQVRLLRVLETGEYIRVGSSKVMKTDVRVVAATNVNIADRIAKGKFREDLYYRLNSVPIRVPALRERPGDIYPLFVKFAADFSDKYHVPTISLTEEAQSLLRAYRWPGNVRQLMGFTQALTAQVSSKVTPTLQRIELSAQELTPFMPMEEGEPIPVVFDGGAAAQGTGAGTPNIDLQPIVKAIFDLNQRIDDLEARVNRRQLPPPPEPAATRPEEAEWQGAGFAAPTGRIVDMDPDEQPQQDDRPLSLKEKEAEMIRQALEKHHGNRKLAAEELGMSERTLYRKLPDEYRKK